MPVRSDLVINTGPILALAAAGHLHILRDLFAKVTVPYEVVQEIEAGGRTQFAREEFRAASWLDNAPRPSLYRRCCNPRWIREKRRSSHSPPLSRLQLWRSTKQSGVVSLDCMD